MKVIKETNTAISLYKAGQVDQVVISGPQVQANQSDPGFVNYPTATSAFLGYNQTKPAVQNAKVRQAISLVIDRAALAANVLADGSTASTGLIPPGLTTNATSGEDFAKAAGNGLSTDVAALRRAGWRPLLLGAILWILVTATALGVIALTTL